MRIDVYLTQHGYAASRTYAQRLITQGKVKVDGSVVTRPGYLIDEDAEHDVVLSQEEDYVGRGGYKLEAALTAFGISAKDAWCLDVGASTGGFTDCLLRDGAARVYAVDSGSGQLAPCLLEDDRVINIEKCNARYLSAQQLGEDFIRHGGADLIVMDVSFISQCYILPALIPLMHKGTNLVTLIKPQFEVGRERVGKGGIVKDAKARRMAVSRVLTDAASLGLLSRGVIRSPIQGGDGNVEFLTAFCLARPEEEQALLSQKQSGADVFPGVLY